MRLIDRTHYFIALPLDQNRRHRGKFRILVKNFSDGTPDTIVRTMLHDAQSTDQTMSGTKYRRRMQSDRSNQIRMIQRHDIGHRRTRRYAANVNARPVYRVFFSYFFDHPDNLFYIVATILSRFVIPLPTPVPMRAQGLLRIKHRVPFLAGKLIHPRALRKFRRRLFATMQHHDQRPSLFF